MHFDSSLYAWTFVDVCALSATDPFVDFRNLKSPLLAYLVGGDFPFSNPNTDGVSMDLNVFSNFLDARPFLVPCNHIGLPPFSVQWRLCHFDLPLYHKRMDISRLILKYLWIDMIIYEYGVISTKEKARPALNSHTRQKQYSVFVQNDDNKLSWKTTLTKRVFW